MNTDTNQCVDILDCSSVPNSDGNFDSYSCNCLTDYAWNDLAYNSGTYTCDSVGGSGGTTGTDTQADCDADVLSTGLLLPSSECQCHINAYYDR